MQATSGDYSSESWHSWKPMGENVTFVANDWHAGAPVGHTAQVPQIPQAVHMSTECERCAHTKHTPCRTSEFVAPSLNFHVLISAPPPPPPPPLHPQCCVQACCRCISSTGTERTDPSCTRGASSRSTTWRTKAPASRTTSPRLASRARRTATWSGSTQSLAASRCRCAHSQLLFESNLSPKAPMADVYKYGRDTHFASTIIFL